MRKTKIRPTLTKGVARVPVIMQLEALECGAASLAMVSAYYGKWIPLEKVRADCGVSRDGSNAKNISQAARRYGFETKAFFRTAQSLRTKGQFPCILHWTGNHFVVLNGLRGNYAYLNDPARGAIKVPWEELEASFTGIVINLVPSERFEPGGRRPSMIAFAGKRLTGAGAAVVFVMLTTAISYLFEIINFGMSRFFMDQMLTGHDRELLFPFFVLLILLAAVQLAAAWVQAVYSLRVNAKMAAVGSMSFIWKVLRMPMEFFSQRMAGDIQYRAQMNASIAQTLVDTFAPLVVSTAMMVLYLAVMLRQSLLLTLIGLSALLLNILVSRIVSAKRINITRVQMRDNARQYAASLAGVEMIETIKSNGAEIGFFQRWADYQASVNTQNMKTIRLNQYLGRIPEFLAMFAGYAILVVGVYLTICGRFSLGAVLMFQGLFSSFMTPAMTLVSAGQTLQEMRTRMERIEDVMEYPEDETLAEHKDTEDISGKLQGNLELKNVTFGYSRLDEPLIRDFSMKMKTGGCIALVGASGSGKSTVSNLISGLYRPWSGEILLDGKPRSAWPREVVTGSLAVVDQDIIIFEDTIANNIKMWDDSIQDFEMILAARDAQIHNDIMELSGGYQHKLISGGKNLSGGQRQRLEIARVLAQDPTIIILDEATSALDARTECEVMQAIRDRGISCVVIAHRLSTVRDCDEIIVLDHGKVAERGTHDELMALGGAYADLVTNE